MNKNSDFDDDFLKKIKSMSKEEMEKYFLSLPREKVASYKEISMRVVMLEDFFYIISDSSKESFKNIFNIKIKEIGANPADIIKDYVLLEIIKFYQLAHKEKNRFRLPTAPEYWNKLKDIRDARIAHPDTKNKSNQDVEKLYRAVDEIGFDKIVNEFKKYAETCINFVNNSIFYDQGLNNLKKLMEEDRIKLLDDLGLKKSLRNIRIRKDGSIVESTVDGRIRALLLAIEASKDENLTN